MSPIEESDAVEALKAWAKTHGRTPTRNAFDADRGGGPASESIAARFGGSWARALEAAGLAPNRRAAIGWSDDAICRALRADAKRRKRTPLPTDWVRATKGRPCERTVTLRFGSWPNALEAAGLAATRRRRTWSQTAIADALRA
jgi:hypothetical protein